jgi:hypothetical protein
MKKTKSTALVALLFLLSALAVGQIPSPASIALPDLVKYGKALEDASILMPRKKLPLRKVDLTAAALVVASFKGPSKQGGCSYTPDDIAGYKTRGIWVFMPDELREIIGSRKSEFAADTGLRMKELLGLNPTYKYECILVVSIAPTQLVRPSLALSLEDGENTYPFSTWGGDFPFTGLGYTCDWYYGDGCRYGMSEFYISPGRNWGDTKSCALNEFLASGCASVKSAS